MIWGGWVGWELPLNPLWVMEIPDFPLKLRSQEKNDSRTEVIYRISAFVPAVVAHGPGRSETPRHASFCHFIPFKVTLRSILHLWCSSPTRRSSSCEEHDKSWCGSCQPTWHVALEGKRVCVQDSHYWFQPSAGVKAGQQHGCKKKLHHSDGAPPTTDRRQRKQLCDSIKLQAPLKSRSFYC